MRAAPTADAPLETPATAGGQDAPLRQVAIRSGAYLAGREAAGIVLRLAGLVIVTRRIGPSAYGIYTAAATFSTFAVLLGQMGSEVYLIRMEGPLTRRRCDEAFTFLLVTSLLVTAAGLGLSFALAPWIRPVGVLAPLRVLLLSVPVNVLWAPAQAAIERKFAYRRMGILELGGDAVLYGTAVPLALTGAGAWSLVAGYIAWQTWLLVGAVVLAGLRPRLAWSRETSRALLRHGVGYSLSPWLLSARSSILTLIVGAFAGARGVGYMGFAYRLTTTINFTERGVQRVGMAAISRARDARTSRMAEALEEGVLIQTLAAAVPFAAFGLVARWMVPDVFGRAWLPALPICVLLGLAAVVRIPAATQRVLLFAHGRNIQVAISAAIELVLVVGVAYAAVRSLGAVGYGVASLVGAGATLYTHAAARHYAALRYRRLVVPVAALVPAVCMPVVPSPWSYALLAPTVLLFVDPSTRHELRALAAMLHSSLPRRLRPSWLVRPGSRAPGGTTPLGALVPAMAVAQPGAAPAPRGGPEVAGTNGSSPQPDRRVVGFLAPYRPAALPDDWARPFAYDRVVDAVAEPFTNGDRPSGVGMPGEVDAESARRGRGAGAAAARLMDPDPVTGLASAGVLLARVGRLLGAARGRGWGLVVAAIEVGGAAGHPAERAERDLAAVAAALRAELRFDDPVARLGPSTFVVAVPYVRALTDATRVAAHLETAAAAALAGSCAGPGGVRAAHVVATLPSDAEADRLVREVLERVRS